MKRSPALFAAVWAAVSVAGLAGCDGGDLAQPARDHRSVELAEAPAPAPEAGPRVQRASAPLPAADRGEVRQVAGRPMWADSRRYSAEENAAYQFGQHGEELAAADLDDFLAKAHRFVNRPPARAATLTRANGDTLVYDAESGLFGVARSDGAPRTVFKPRDGEAYWAQQVRENGQGRASTRRADSGG
jgi:hypothetical protein